MMSNNPEFWQGKDTSGHVLTKEERESRMGRIYFDEALQVRSFATDSIAQTLGLNRSSQRQVDAIIGRGVAEGFVSNLVSVSFYFSLANFDDRDFFEKTAGYVRSAEDITQPDWTTMRKLLIKHGYKGLPAVRMRRKPYSRPEEDMFVTLDGSTYEAAFAMYELIEDKEELLDRDRGDEGMATVLLASMTLASMKSADQPYQSIEDLKQGMTEKGLGALYYASRYVSDRRFVDQMIQEGILEAKDTELFLRVLAGWNFDLSAELQRLRSGKSNSGLVAPIDALRAMNPSRNEKGYWPHALFLKPMVEMTAAYYLMLPSLIQKGGGVALNEVTANWDETLLAISKYVNGRYFEGWYHEDLVEKAVWLEEHVIEPWASYMKYHHDLLDRRDAWVRADDSVLEMRQIFDDIRAAGGKGSRKAFYFPFSKHGPLR